MTVIRTFLNAGAARGTGEDVDKTLQLLKDETIENSELNAIAQKIAQIDLVLPNFFCLVWLSGDSSN